MKQKVYKQLSLDEMSNLSSRLTNKSEQSSMVSPDVLTQEQLLEQIAELTIKNQTLKSLLDHDQQSQITLNRIHIALEIFEDDIQRLNEQYSDSQRYYQFQNADKEIVSQAQIDLMQQLQCCLDDMQVLNNKIETESNATKKALIAYNIHEYEEESAKLEEQQIELAIELDSNERFQENYKLLQFSNKYHIFSLPTFFPPQPMMLNPVKSNNTIIIPKNSKIILLQLLHKSQNLQMFRAFNFKLCKFCSVLVYEELINMELLAKCQFEKGVDSYFIVEQYSAEFISKSLGNLVIKELAIEIPEIEPIFLTNQINSYNIQEQYGQKETQTDFIIIIEEIAEALKQLSQDKLIYGQLCSENIIFNDNVWRLLPPLYSSKSNINAVQTIIPQPFVAPETEKTCKSDIYSLGIIMFELMQGNIDILYRAQEEVLNIVRSEIEEKGVKLFVLEPELLELMYSALEENPENRPEASRIVKVLDGMFKKEIKKFK